MKIFASYSGKDRPLVVQGGHARLPSHPQPAITSFYELTTEEAGHRHEGPPDPLLGRLQRENDPNASFEFGHQVLGQNADLPSERFVGHGNQLTEEQITVYSQPPLPLGGSESQDAGGLHQPRGGGNDNRRGISRPIDEI